MGSASKNPLHTVRGRWTRRCKNQLGHRNGVSPPLCTSHLWNVFKISELAELDSPFSFIGYIHIYYYAFLINGPSCLHEVSFCICFNVWVLVCVLYDTHGHSKYPQQPFLLHTRNIRLRVIITARSPTSRFLLFLRWNTYATDSTPFVIWRMGLNWGRVLCSSGWPRIYSVAKVCLSPWWSCLHFPSGGGAEVHTVPSQPHRF